MMHMLLVIDMGRLPSVPGVGVLLHPINPQATSAASRTGIILTIIACIQGGLPSTSRKIMVARASPNTWRRDIAMRMEVPMG